MTGFKNTLWLLVIQIEMFLCTLDFFCSNIDPMLTKKSLTLGVFTSL